MPGKQFVPPTMAASLAQQKRRKAIQTKKHGPRTRDCSCGGRQTRICLCCRKRSYVWRCRKCGKRERES